MDLSHVPGNYQDRLRSLLRKYYSIWSGNLGEIAASEHHIDLVPGTRLITQHPYRAGPRTQEIEQQHVDHMLRKGLVEPGQSALASRVIIVPKEDGSLRFCVDYRNLNSITVRGTYCLPRMDECIDSLGDTTVCTTLDAKSGYQQVPIADNDHEKTAFVCHAGLYRFKGMLFGLTNATVTI